MILSLLSAFVFPRRMTDVGHSQFAALLIPISRPSYRIANAIRAHFVQPVTEDSRPDQAIATENLALKEQIQRMTAQIDKLQQRAGERASLGGFETFCQRFEVTGTDGDNRDGLTIGGLSFNSVRLGQPVLSSGTVVDLIGRVDNVGMLSAHVSLITDAGFAVTGHFVSYSAAGAQENKTLQAIVRGRGAGRLMIDTLPLSDVRGSVNVGDWVVLSDDTWPRALQGVRIGRITSIQPSPKQSLFAEIQLASESSLLHLNDVWVMTHQP